MITDTHSHPTENDDVLDEACSNHNSLSCVQDEVDDRDGDQELFVEHGQLRIDDLSSNDGEDERIDVIMMSKPISSKYDKQPPESMSASFGSDTQRMDDQLQVNLQQQQAHYARQRKLFDQLRRSPQQVLNSSISEHSQHTRDEESIRTTLSSKYQMKLADNVPKSSHSIKASSDEDATLQQRANQIASIHARHSIDTSSTKPSRHRSRTSSSLEHDYSNEALRKQLELLRRLQHENNRFRHDNRVLRESNEELEEQVTLHNREIRRLREEIQELTLRVENDQLQIATASQSARKLKQVQKQLSTKQTEYVKLECTLQDAMDQQQQQALRTQNEIDILRQETKHLKRSLKAAKQQEMKLMSEGDELRALIATMEADVNQTKRELQDSRLESANVATQLSEQMTHVHTVENSATECVQRMEAGMEALQKAHTSEREKRKKVEKVRDALQSQVDNLTESNQMMEEKIQHLQDLRSKLETRVQELRQERKHSKKIQEEQQAELQTQQTTHVKTISSLREECESFEQQSEQMRTQLVDLRKEVACESNVIRKEIDSLRNYMEQAIRSTTTRILSSNDDQSPILPLQRTQREELWIQLPELQYLHGAMSGLQNEMMNLVNDYHRTRHISNQQSHKLSVMEERITELEQQHGHDATTMKELREQCVVSEEARAITSQEKMEILKWSQLACEKNEQWEKMVASTVERVQSMIKTLQYKRELHGDNSVERKTFYEDEKEDLPQNMLRLEREVNRMVERIDHLQETMDQMTQDLHEQQDLVRQCRLENETKTHEHRETLEEIEMLHAQHLEEKQMWYTTSLQALEQEKDTLEMTCTHQLETIHTLEIEQERLQTFERDLPIWHTLVSLFQVVVPPLILQVHDLLLQKRILVRENHEYKLQQEQIECIGQVLEELVPPTDPSRSNRCIPLKRRFRRVVIAVFAFNRFQHHLRMEYGICTSLKAPKSNRKKIQTDATMIKVCGVKKSPDLESIVGTMRRMKLSSKLEKMIVEPRGLGHVLMQVVGAIESPSIVEWLLECTNGHFHCQSLIERRRGSRPSESVDTLSTVDHIRQRILALGKRVENLHYQRNVLQKENYALQFTVEQQKTQLTDMSTLSAENQALEQELVSINEKYQEASQQRKAEIQAKDELIQHRTVESVQHCRQVEVLEGKLVEFTERMNRLEKVKTDLETTIQTLQCRVAEGEESVRQSRAAVDRQREEMRIVKQAATRAHAMHQRMEAQYEQELASRSSLEAQVEHFKRQKAILEKQVHCAQVRAVERSFALEDEEDNELKRNGKIKSQEDCCKLQESRIDHDTQEDLETLAERLRHVGTAIHFDLEEVQDEHHESTRSSDTFRKEWQRLDITCMFDDKEEEDYPPIISPQGNDKSIVPKPLSNSPATTRRMEIDKVNAAVHEYMDRIDEKLKQMYGIPPSTAKDGVSQKALEKKYDDDQGEVKKKSKRTRSVASKVSEVRRL